MIPGDHVWNGAGKLLLKDCGVEMVECGWGPFVNLGWWTVSGKPIVERNWGIVVKDLEWSWAGREWMEGIVEWVWRNMCGVWLLDHGCRTVCG